MSWDTFLTEIMKLESTLTKMWWYVRTTVCTSRASLHQRTTCGWRKRTDRWRPLTLGSSILNCEPLNVWTFPARARTNFFWTGWVLVGLGWNELVRLLKFNQPRSSCHVKEFQYTIPPWPLRAFWVMMLARATMISTFWPSKMLVQQPSVKWLATHSICVAPPVFWHLLWQCCSSESSRKGQRREHRSPGSDLTRQEGNHDKNVRCSLVLDKVFWDNNSLWQGNSWQHIRIECFRN